MVVRNQTTEQPAKLRLDGYGTIFLDAYVLFWLIIFCKKQQKEAVR